MAISSARGAAWAASLAGAGLSPAASSDATVGAVSATMLPSFGSMPMARRPSSVMRATIQVPSSSWRQPRPT